MEIRPGRDDDAADAAAFIADLQDEPSSMIPYLSCGLGAITEELGKLASPWTETARLAFQGDTLVGLAFVEIDTQQGRVWINGPWVVHERWDSVADILVQQLLDDIVPAGIGDVELCGHLDHHRLASLAERWGLARSNVFVVLGLDRAQTVGWAPPILSPLTDAHAEAVGRLHDELFPGAPWTGRQLLDKAGSQVTVLVATEAHRVAGYVAAEVQPGPEGYIHFVGVDGDHRRRGTGRTLVMAAVAEMLVDPAVSRVFLSVDSTNAAAVALYRSLGFSTELAMVGFRTPAEHRRPPGPSKRPLTATGHPASELVRPMRYLTPVLEWACGRARRRRSVSSRPVFGSASLAVGRASCDKCSGGAREQIAERSRAGSPAGTTWQQRGDQGPPHDAARVRWISEVLGYAIPVETIPVREVVDVMRRTARVRMHLCMLRGPESGGPMTHTGMTSRLVALCFDANDPLRLARFWAVALRRQIDDESHDEIGLVPTDDTRFRIEFFPVPEKKVGTNRLHLDLTTASIDDQEEMVARLVELGAPPHRCRAGPRRGSCRALRPRRQRVLRHRAE